MDVTDAVDDAPAHALSYAPLAPPPASAHRVWTVFVAFVAAVASALAFSMIVVALFVATVAWRLQLRGVRVAPSELTRLLTRIAVSPAGLLGSGLASCLSFAFFALVPASLSPELLGARLRLGASRRWFLWGIVTGVGLLGIGEACSGVMALTGLEGRGSLGVIHRALAHPSLPMAVAAVTIVGVGAGVGEELFFRGYVQSRLAQRWGSWVAVLVTAALFGLVHLDAVHSSFAFLVGLLLGWASLRTGTIRTTIVAHVLNNIVSVVGMELSTPGRRTPPSEAAIELSIGVAMVALCVLALRQAPRVDAP